MSEAKLLKYVFNSKSEKLALLNKQAKSVNEEESEMDEDNKVNYDKTIDNIVTSTSRIIDHPSITVNCRSTPKQILDSSVQRKKLRVIPFHQDTLRRRLLEEKQLIIVKTEPNVNLKGMTGKESSKYSSIDNSTIFDTTDNNTIRNEVMTLPEDDTITINKANSEISETTLNLSPLSTITSINIDKRFRLSTGELESPRSFSPSLASSPASPTSLILGVAGNPIVVSPHSYFSEEYNSLPRNLFFSYNSNSNYALSYENSMLDDFDNESTTFKKKKSVRFSNIVDVIDSDQKDTLAELEAFGSKANQVNGNLETQILIDVEDKEEVKDDDMTTMNNSRDDVNQVSCLMKVEEVVAIFFTYLIYIFSSIFSIFKFNKENKKSYRYKNQFETLKDNDIYNNNSISQNAIVNEDTISPSSINCLKELNSTCIISNVNNNNNKKEEAREIEICPLKTENEKNTVEHLIIESEVVERMHMPTKNPTTVLESSPMTVNSLSQKRGNRVVRYWYDNNKKTIVQRFGLFRGNQSFKKLKNINSKQNSKQGDQNLLVKTKEVSKVKRSSLVNFKPTNIDINSIPNINATTTTNTILNSSSPYREEKGQMSNRKGIVIHDLNHADGVPDSILNSSSPFREGKDQNVKRKGIIIRDLNNADGICYEIKINSSEESDEKGENSSKTALSNNDNINTIENNDGSSSSSSTVSFSLNNSNNKRTGRKYSHKRQNSVRLEISY